MPTYRHTSGVPCASSSYSASKVSSSVCMQQECHAAQWYSRSKGKRICCSLSGPDDDKCLSCVCVCVSHMDRVTIVLIGMNSGRALTTADILFILRQPIVLLLPVNKQEHYYTKY